VAEITTPRVAPVSISGGTTYTQWASGGIAASGNVMKSMPMTLTQNSTDGVPSGWTEVPYTYYAQVGTIDETARPLTFRWNGYLSNEYRQMRLRWTKTVDDAPILETSLKIKQHGEYTVRGLEPDTEYFFMLDVMFQGQWRLFTGCVGRTLAYSTDYPKLKNIGNATGTVTFRNWHWSVQTDLKYRLKGASSWTATTLASNQSVTATVPAGSVLEFQHNGEEGVLNVVMDSPHTAFGNFGLCGASCQNLFQNDTLLTDAAGMYKATSSALMTHARVVEYQCAFDGCTYLETPPDMSHWTHGGTFAFQWTFHDCKSLVVAADFSNMTDLEAQVFQCTYAGCTALRKGSDIRNAVNWSDISQFDNMYAGCSALNEAWVPNIRIWDNDRFNNWLGNVNATGTLHAPSGLVIPSGAGGIPSGWTRENY
jgi:hypothetical protein